MAIERRLSFDPKTFLAKVGEGRSIGSYRKDQVVFSQGDPADAVFYIQKGKVKVTVVSEQGKEAVVAILGAGDFFGEACLAGQARRLATVAAMADSIIVWQAQAADLLFVLALWGSNPTGSGSPPAARRWHIRSRRDTSRHGPVTGGNTEASVQYTEGRLLMKRHSTLSKEPP